MLSLNIRRCSFDLHKMTRGDPPPFRLPPLLLGGAPRKELFDRIDDLLGEGLFGSATGLSPWIGHRPHFKVLPAFIAAAGKRAKGGRALSSLAETAASDRTRILSFRGGRLCSGSLLAPKGWHASV